MSTQSVMEDQTKDSVAWLDQRKGSVQSRVLIVVTRPIKILFKYILSRMVVVLIRVSYLNDGFL